jgi:hypothetical protein
VWVDQNLGVGLFTYTQLASIPLILVALWQLSRIRQQPEQPWDEGVPIPVPNAPKTLTSSAKAK